MRVQPHERLVASRPVFSLFLAQVSHGGAQVVGAVLLWDPTKLPERFLNALGQRLEGFAEAQTGGLRVGVGQHKMIEQVWERFPANRHAQILHVREIRLRPLAWGMVLFKDHW